jgi:acid phosphatase type 7
LTRVWILVSNSLGGPSRGRELTKRSGFRRVAAAVGVVVLAIVTTPAEGLTSTFTAVADSFVRADSVSTNFGQLADLRIDGSPVQRSYLRFSVQGLTNRVSKATLKIYSTDASGGPVEVRKVADNTWGETTITYNNAPAFSSTVYGTSSPFVGSAWNQIDVTPLITGNATYSIVLVTADANGAVPTSRESTRPPQLVVETTTSSDATAPTRPSGVKLASVDFNWVNVSWSASSDNVGVTGYTVYRNNAVLATVSGSTLRFSDTTVAPSTSYSYQVAAFDAAGNRSSRSSSLSIKTPSLPSYPVIAAAGDIACDPANSSFNAGNGISTQCRQKYTSNSLVNAKFKAVLALGDTQYESGVYDAYLKSYDPTWGRVKAISRPVPGNHEYRTSGAGGYFRYFGALAGDPSNGYYSYDLGNWHIIALNSATAHDAGSAQVKWLQGDLAASTKPCTLAYFHHPRWSSGPHGNDTSVGPFWNALYTARADVVLVGHDHTYERFAPQSPSGAADSSNGIRQFVVGTGGKTLYNFPSIKPNSQARNNTTYGVLMLKLQSSSYSWRFVPEAGGTFTDSGTTSCH